MELLLSVCKICHLTDMYTCRHGRSGIQVCYWCGLSLCVLWSVCIRVCECVCNVACKRGKAGWRRCLSPGRGRVAVTEAGVDLAALLGHLLCAPTQAQLVMGFEGAPCGAAMPRPTGEH